MKILAIETSGSVGSVSLKTGENTETIDFPEGTRHGVSLVPSMEELLNGAGVRPGDLDAVAVSTGPGSYTGLRVGLVSAKILCFTCGPVMVTVPTFDAVARNVPEEHRDICVVGDARRGEVYSSCYQVRNGRPERTSEHAIVVPGKLLSSLEQGTFLVGDGIPVVRPADDTGHFVYADEKFWVPRSDAVAAIGAELYTEGVTADIETTEPIYLRRPAAEEKWEQREAESK